MKLLGISAYYHDSAAAIIIDDKIVAASQEERFSRTKHDKSFPILSCKYCLQESNLNISDLDYIVFYEKPIMKFDRLLESIIEHAPLSYKMYLKAMPIWLKDKLNMRSLIRKELRHEFGKFNVPIRFIEHHWAHAASAFFTSGFEESAILVIDAVGEWSTTSLLYGNGNKIQTIKEQHFPDSIGLLYSAFTYYLGFKVNSDEYKVMGLAPYGHKESDDCKKFIKTITEKLVLINDDGRIQINKKAFCYQYGLTMVNCGIWEALFGLKRRHSKEPITQKHCNLALAIQLVTESIIQKLAITIKRITGSSNLCIAGGTALNCTVNGILLKSELFEHIYIPCSPGDAGGAIGAATGFSNIKAKTQIHFSSSPYTGPEYTNENILCVLESSLLDYVFIGDDADFFRRVAYYIANQKVIGWFQGRMEFGPRALGNRSILADHRNPNMKKIINSSIKYRENFRPFAPTILEEATSDWFALKGNSPFMMFTVDVQPSLRKEVDIKDFTESINLELSSIPAVTHIGYSSRVQTINKKQNIRYYSLIKAFYEITGCPILLNTSFNVMGEPIVCSPKDAIHTFLHSGIDILAIGNYIVFKK